MSHYSFFMTFLVCLLLIGCDGQSGANNEPSAPNETATPVHDSLSSNQHEDSNTKSGDSNNVNNTSNEQISCIDSACPPGHACVDGICVKSPDEPGKSNDEIEHPEQENPTGHDLACPPDSVSINGVACLKEIYFNIPCEPQCADGDICYLGECIPESSCKMVPCKYDMHCIDHACVEVDEDNMGCPPDTVKVNDTACIDVELFDLPCQKSCDVNELCYKGNCVPQSSCEIISCQENKVCKDHVCRQFLQMLFFIRYLDKVRIIIVQQL